MKFTSIIAIALVVVFASCTKDATVTSKVDLLTGGSSKSWKLSSVTATVSGKTVDITSALLADACDKDDFVTFKTGGIFIEDEGPLKCSSTDPQSATGKFVIDAKETTVTTTVGSDVEVITFVELSSSKFVGSSTNPLFGVLTATFVPK